MKRARFLTAYDGRAYEGWQSQPSGRTVQDRLESALAVVLGQPMRVHGAGRTDAGVHALGQSFHVDLPETCSIPEEKWPIVLNDKLPPDIRITRAAYTDESFHARFSALGKTYRYRISRESVLSPFDAGLAWHRPRTWSPELMAAALRLFEGEHDFRAFAALRGNEPKPLPPDYFRRTIRRASLEESAGHVLLSFEGSGFLYKMVRLMVGAAFEAARGKLPLERLAQLIQAPRPTDKSPLCAPPDGLTLVRVRYADEIP